MLQKARIALAALRVVKNPERLEEILVMAGKLFQERGHQAVPLLRELSPLARQALADKPRVRIDRFYSFL